MDSRTRKQSSTTHPIKVLIVQSADHVTGLPGVTGATITLFKDGATTGVTATGALTECTSGGGNYWWAGNATDRNTPGVTGVKITATNADPVDFDMTIVPWDPFDGNLSLTGLAGLTAPTAGALPTVGTGTNQINAASGKVPATLAAADVSGNVAADLQTVKAQAVTAAAPVTVLASVGTAATSTAQTGDSYALANGASGFAAIKGNTAAVVAKLPVNNIADETLLLAAIGTPAQAAQIPANFTTATFASAGVFSVGALANAPTGSGGGSAQSGDVYGLINPLVSAGALTAAALANAPKTGHKLAADGLDAVTVETGVNARQSLALIGAATAGKASGLDTATATYFAMGASGTTTARISAVTDLSGNRTATTLSPPA